MGHVAESGGRLRLVAGVILVVALLLCAIFMPAMAMAALVGCVGVIALVTLANRAPIPVRPRQPYVVERADTPTPAMATGPPVPVPLRT